MNCAAFSRRLLVDPNSKEPGFRAHVTECPDCTRALSDALAFDEQLREALIDVLGSGADPSTLIQHGYQRRLSVLLFLALLTFVVWLGLRGGLHRDESDWPDLVIGHILTEQDHLDDQGEVPPAGVERLFSSVGGKLDQDLGQVRQAALCPIGGRHAVHLTLAGEIGPVTVLFMPGEAVPASRDMDSGGLQGVLVPAGFGNLAVVGLPGEPVDAVLRRMLAGVHWERLDSRH